MADKREFWVFSEKSGLLVELISGAGELAAQLGGQVAALVLGPRSEAEKALAQGAARVLWLGDLPAGKLVEDYVPTLEKLVKEQSPFAFFIGATKRGKAVAGRLAARIGASAITDVKQFLPEAGALQARHLIFGGGAVRVEKATSSTLLATVGMSIFEVKPGAGGGMEIVDVPFVAPAWTVALRERKSKGVSSVNLAAAKRVVCPGRGVGKEEDLGLVNDLACTLEAEVGCTRPLAEGLNWLPRERYIGVSGAFLKADLYVGIGVSGQVQHTVGITDSRVIVAINKDKGAPIFEQADYGIVGDLYSVLPALIKAINARK
jgi:electron transfer flavoprotein alpha subunit